MAPPQNRPNYDQNSVFVNHPLEKICYHRFFIQNHVSKPMAILPILEFPDPRLRKKALPVEHVDEAIQRLVDDLFETMYAEKGAGLAANQVNIQQRIVVMDVSEEGNQPICAINPEIIHREGLQYETEACLSVPVIAEQVERAYKVRLRALDRQGQPFEVDAEGYFAKCIQHELDHLDGILFIDHLSKLKFDRARKKIEKSKRRVES